jgi:hypothetical protein
MMLPVNRPVMLKGIACGWSKLVTMSCMRMWQSKQSVEVMSNHADAISEDHRRL